jgi:hypothetical protein
MYSDNMRPACSVSVSALSWRRSALNWTANTCIRDMREYVVVFRQTHRDIAAGLAQQAQ